MDNHVHLVVKEGVNGLAKFMRRIGTSYAKYYNQRYNDIGGLMLTRLSDIAVMLFYGNEQNMAGMRLVLPKVMNTGIPFFLINSPVPLSEGERKEEEQIYLENAYKIFLENDYYNAHVTRDGSD